MITTGSPVSRFGVKVALFLPRRVAATCVARRPSTAPSASTTRQCRSISLAFALLVLLLIVVVAICPSPRSFSSVVRHAHQTEPACRCARPGHRAIFRSHDLAEPLDADLAAPGPEQGPHDRADHAPEERVGLDLEPEEIAFTRPLRAPHRSDTTFAAREGREVPPSDQCRARLAHRIQPKVDRMVIRPALERIAFRSDPKPIFIYATRRPVPGVEFLLARLDRRDRDVLGQEGVYPPAHLRPVQLARRPEAHDLS